mmetsp:Transcript_19776/g.64294  ORF Transcript_19776/g.64294 Transcript_19776/m.64294 type:complete len:284 (+) Transcript_19776:44-895(+)
MVRLRAVTYVAVVLAGSLSLVGTASQPFERLCEDVSKHNSEQDGNYPELKPPRACRVAFILAGAPRSGSTYVWKITNEILESIGFNPTYTGYYRYDIHTHMSRAKSEEFVRETQELWSNFTNRSILVLKSHEYREELLTDYCDQSLVLTGYRNLSAVAASALRLGWFQAPALRRFLSDYTRNHHCWAAHSSFNIAFEEVERSPAAVVAQLDALVRSLLGEPLRRTEVLAEQNLVKDSEMTVDGGREVSPADKQAIVRAVAEHQRWQNLHGYARIRGPPLPFQS